MSCMHVDLAAEAVYIDDSTGPIHRPYTVTCTDSGITSVHIAGRGNNVTWSSGV
ncbi:hypothetical protein COCC4DRAFT_30795 [Bipolaris maydis ATCC 48331]|uniref:Uncharacterized protein n=2 Tax=Cochliobolus heterostrophus TaxID=5016 RepID=M2UXN5_COCH5|nr:uncharacterized protein COCC4DRAFT_30795 [Bipolaris maydis ATCC 48331]EMD92588.1 hypothetical protein COCHEDRAFT_1021297 [Bipolaris maydis C5]ENI08284.1 hypothetical protein COCC4DRAFT_30795 [Bipolaris maydis ATCC 48331]